MNSRTLAKVKAPDGTLLKLKRPDLDKTRLELADGGWDLVVGKGRAEHRFTGEDARKTASVLVSRINRNGAGRRTVQDAVRRLDLLGTPEAVLEAAATEQFRSGFKKRAGHLTRLTAPTRLAVEMALHEEEERRALQGELWLLERRWKEAEEIAAISDSLLLPEGAEEFVERQRAGSAG
jgi:hypothetical protein